MSRNDGLKTEIKYDSHLPVLRLTRSKQKDMDTNWNRPTQRRFNITCLYVVISGIM